MKVKLLKKIRKRFSIVYYPNRKDDYKYLLIDNDESSVGNIFYILDIKNEWSSERQFQIDRILKYCRWAYRKYSKAGKFENQKTKVWHNG